MCVLFLSPLCCTHFGSRHLISLVRLVLVRWILVIIRCRSWKTKTHKKKKTPLGHVTNQLCARKSQCRRRTLGPRKERLGNLFDFIALVPCDSDLGHLVPVYRVLFKLTMTARSSSGLFCLRLKPTGPVPDDMMNCSILCAATRVEMSRLTLIRSKHFCARISY